MDLKKINELLKDFSIRNTIAVEVKRPDGENYENGYEIYQLSEDLYIKFEIYEDSYGSNEQVKGIQFVKPKTVTVTNFEPINE
jgi:hypothetical protein